MRYRKVCWFKSGLGHHPRTEPTSCEVRRVTVSTPCIYCGEPDPKKFSGREHVIPQAFGHFGSQTPVLKCVCDDCNSLFGRELDQVHARDTLEGVLRYKQGIVSSENRPQRRLRFTLADEAESGELFGAAVAGVDPTNDELRPLVAQLHILNQQTGETEIFTRPQLRILELRNESYGAPGERKLHVFAPSKEDYDAFVEELNTAGFDVRMGAPYTFDIKPTIGADGRATIGVHIECIFDDLHRRALAKILINFAAFYLGSSEVRKPEWTPVKRFVRYAEGLLGARLSDKPFWTGQETDNWRYPDALNIRLENDARGLIGAIQFYNRITYELLLIEDYRSPREIAARFEAGSEPEIGQRGRPG
jgi:hypothetical protein